LRKICSKRAPAAADYGAGERERTRSETKEEDCSKSRRPRSSSTRDSKRGRDRQTEIEAPATENRKDSRKKERGGMRASSSSAADEGKSSSILAGLRYKVWRAVFGAMKKVREGLYIGNIRDAAAVLSAAEEEEEEEENERPSSSPAAAVTHILSLISQEINPLDFKRPASRDPRAAAPPPSSPNKNCKLKQKTVPLLDIHSQNLLDHLEDCLEFIESGRNSGGVVLVHCFAGVSRRQASINLLPPILYLCISRRG
jgi:dual specificity phosphatase 12